MALVQMKDLNEHKDTIFRHKSYKEIYYDVRKAVDLCHRDGTLKEKVAKEPERYKFKFKLI